MLFLAQVANEMSAISYHTDNNMNNNDKSCMPELLQEVAGRLVSVEEGLAALDNHRTALNNNADMVSFSYNRHICLLNKHRNVILNPTYNNAILIL